MSEQIYLERDGAIATIVLNQPERHNAMNATMFTGIGRFLEECDRDAALRCVIVRGAGGKAFSAGADISEFETVRSSKKRALDYGVMVHKAFGGFERCRHPIIAQIDGLCVGGGLGIAAACDLRVCGESSRFGVPVKRLGLVEAHNEMGPLVRKFGPNVAMEILVVGDVFGVADAVRMGIVNKVVPDAEVGAATRKLAESIADGAPLSARWHKKFIYRLLDPKPLTAAEIDEGFDCYDTEDFQIGYKAFLAKQKPTFVGR